MVKLPSLSVVGTVEPPADDHLSATVTYFLAPTDKKIHGLTLVKNVSTTAIFAYSPRINAAFFWSGAVFLGTDNSASVCGDSSCKYSTTVLMRLAAVYGGTFLSHI